MLTEVVRDAWLMDVQLVLEEAQNIAEHIIQKFKMDGTLQNQSRIT